MSVPRARRGDVPQMRCGDIRTSVFFVGMAASCRCRLHRIFLYIVRRQAIFTFGKNLLTLRGFIFVEMIVELISKYLETHKRLVVPNLGAFIVKVPGESVLFSNLIKNDDGVLRSLLMSSGVSEMEAAAAVDRFVFEVRIRLQNNGVCRLGGFGELRSGANETISFVYSPATPGDGGVDVESKPSRENNVSANAGAVREHNTTVAQHHVGGDTISQQPRHEASPAPAQPLQQRQEPQPYARASRPQQDVRPLRSVASDDSRAQYRAPEVAETIRAERHGAETQPDSDREVYERPRSQDVRRDRMKALYDEPTISVSPKRHPADYVKGLRYGKGRKVSPDRGLGSQSRRRNDRILIIAIVAAALAIAALGYGYYCDVRAARMESDYYGVESDGVTNPDLEYIEEPNE